MHVSNWLLCFCIILFHYILYAQDNTSPQTSLSNQAINKQNKIIFQGNHHHTSQQLEKVIAEPWKKYLEQTQLAYIDDAAYSILRYYRQNGFSFAEVDYEINSDSILFNIHEGKAIYVNKIEFIGKLPQENQEINLSFSDEQLRKFLTKPAFLDKHLFNRQQIESDISALRDFYLSKGYLEYSHKIEYIWDVPPPESQSVIINVYIQEGPQCYIAEIKFVGNENISEEILKKELGFDKPIIYTPGMPNQIANQIKDYYHQQGYAQVVIQTEIEQSTSLPKSRQQNHCIIFSIQEGSIYKIRQISIQGQLRAEPDIIRRQLDFYEGDVYTISNIRSSLQNLHETGLFTWAEVKETILPPEEMDLAVVVEERNARLLTLHVGYATSYGPTAGAEFEHINAFGRGWKFSSAIETTLFAGELDKSSITIQLTEPYFLGSRTWSFSVKAFVLYEVTPSYTSFDQGLSFIFEKKFSKVLTGQFSYNLLWSRILDVQEEISDTKVGTTFFATTAEKITLNLRDNNSYPTSGSYHFIEMEQSLTALAAEIDYFKIYGHSAWYFRITGQCVFSIAARGGVIVPFGNSNSIPIQRRYFSGGIQTIRSFKERQLPPWDYKNNPLGGEGIFLFSSELRIPIYGNLGISLFGDMGQLISEIRSIKDYRINHLKYAIGLGIWYNTPVGPIRGDIGFNPDREINPYSGTKEDLFAWFISIGFSF